MMKFYEDVENAYCELEDVAAHLLDNPGVKAYFMEYYNFDPEVDDTVHTLLEYMIDKYSI